MMLMIVLSVTLFGIVRGDDFPLLKESADPVERLKNTELVQVFAIFRHGDRTPEDLELELFNSSAPLNENIFFPFGKKALTNEGKQRAFLVGSYLRGLYDGFISRLYLPEEIVVRTTAFDRTKMTALVAMAAMYPPLPSQKWNPNLDWQPVPYFTLPVKDDDLEYYQNCPRFLILWSKEHQKIEVKNFIESQHEFFKYISDNFGRNITNTQEVFFLYGLFHALNNIGIETPAWAQEVMPKIIQMSGLDFAISLHTNDLVKFSTGVLVNYILKTMKAAIDSRDKPMLPKMHLFCAHDTNVAAMLAAVRVFEPHPPHYGATFTLELRKQKVTGNYGITAVYAPNAGGPGHIMPIPGCDSTEFCNYETFVSLMKDVAWTPEERSIACNSLT